MARLPLVILFAIPLCAEPRAVAHIPLPADIAGSIQGTDYRIRVPANWNGTLLLYAHGSATTNLEVSPQVYPPASHAVLEQLLLDRGYALAGSWYHDHEVTSMVELTAMFNGKVGTPLRTIVWGVSWGGSVAIELVESYHSLYDGGIAVAPPGTDGGGEADFDLHFDVAYAACFGWPTAAWGPLEDLRDDLMGNEMTLIAPFYEWDYTKPEWEFIRLIMKMSPESWYSVDPLLGVPGYGLAGWKGTAHRSSQEARFGGPVATNVGVVYSLTAAERAYLMNLGLDPEPLLASMNAGTNITARTSARVRVETHLRHTGRLRRPLITVHGMHDPMLPPWHETFYKALVDAAGASENLVQTWVSTPGHVPFTADHFLSALAAMEHWLDTGVRPGPSYFPEGQGFDHSFVPPPLPY